ncbi:PepSY domain-containing protein [Streptomyces sp. b94]|uniref:PepSY domain-containing protein n=1 Tax=Streptomyces sp. b94 TaxID=1827634 RepID=UPI001B37CB89|nr:PepSY domain-containing protein [Streptomyces sp. b94]MBQ1100321.1 PepSY domain-containing protein [Streptomyces sp. b94]
MADVSLRESELLVANQVILPLTKLNEAAVTRHPGAKMLDTDLQEQSGRYIYTVTLVDTAGSERTIDLDAATGNVVKDERS